MANQQLEPYILDFPNGKRVEDILKKADSDYSRAEIDAALTELLDNIAARYISRLELETNYLVGGAWILLD